MASDINLQQTTKVKKGLEMKTIPQAGLRIRSDIDRTTFQDNPDPDPQA